MREMALDVANHLCLPSKKRGRKEGDEEMKELLLNLLISLTRMEDAMEKYSVEEEEEKMMKCLRSVKVEELGMILDYYYVREYFIFILLLSIYIFFEKAEHRVLQDTRHICKKMC